MSDIRVINARDLTPDIVEQWQTIAACERYLHSLFFQPAFTQAVARIRDDAEIALFEKRGELTGVLPFQRGPRGLMRNICTRLSEFHTPVIRPEMDFDGIELMHACGASYWQFDDLPTVNSPVQKWNHFLWSHFL